MEIKIGSTYIFNDLNGVHPQWDGWEVEVLRAYSDQLYSVSPNTGEIMMVKKNELKVEGSVDTEKKL